MQAGRWLSDGQSQRFMKPTGGADGRAYTMGTTQAISPGLIMWFGDRRTRLVRGACAWQLLRGGIAQQPQIL